jgi:energy-coupling factor transporter ATPase
MDTMIELNQVCYEYKRQQANLPGVRAINGISERVEQGEFVVVLGRNGSGKSTLARLMNALLLPDEGTVIVEGMRTSEEGHLWDIRKSLGLVFQNPDNQIVATTIEEDIAFGPENLGIEPDEIRRRVDAAARYVGMEEYLDHSPHMLSGGQKQRIAIAGILAMEPKCIVLDESTSMLDPNGRKEVMDLIATLNRDKNITIILITHHMDEAVHADRVFVMEDGRISMKGTPREIFSRVDELKRVGLDVPHVTSLMHRLAAKGIYKGGACLDMEEAANGLKSILSRVPAHARGRTGAGRKRQIEPGEPVAQIRDLTHIYMPGTAFEKKALDGISLDIMKGEVLGIIGHTGSGKSTLVQHLNGILKPTSGSVEVDGLKAEGKTLKELRRKVGLIFQYPEQQLFEETVYKDIIFGLGRMNLPQDEIDRRVRNVIGILGLSEDILEKSPFELSGGQKRRVAIAGVLVMEPSILILDEPTAGLDPKGSREVFSILLELNRKNGTTIVIISHNMDDVAAYCTRVAVMRKGRLEMIGAPGEVFRQAERLKELDLDIPKITELFGRLTGDGCRFTEPVLSIREAESIIMDMVGYGNIAPGGDRS